MKRRLFFVFSINFFIALVEIFGGLTSRSNALLSDALHNLQDALSQLLALVAIIISEKGKSSRYTFGFKRFEIIAALLNAIAISVISANMIIGGFRRLFHPEVIIFDVMLAVSVFGLFGNLLSIAIIHRHVDESLNVKSSFLHLLGDTFSSLGVVIGAIAIRIFKIYWLDGLISALIAVFIIKEAIGVITESFRVILQGAPFRVDEVEISRLLSEVEGVKGVHHVHVWSLKDGEIFFEAHVEVEDMPVGQTQVIHDKINRILSEKLGVSHTTLQFESFHCDNKTC